MNTALEQLDIGSKDEATEPDVQRITLPSPRLRSGDWPVSSLAGNSVAGRRLFFAHERVGLGGYVFALTGAAAFCSGLCALAVTSVFEVAVPRWFILAYGVSCVLLLLLAPVLSPAASAVPGARPCSTSATTAGTIRNRSRRAPIPFDATGVFPVPSDPTAAGYPAGPARLACQNFNFKYTSMLKSLHAGFNGDSDALDTAVFSQMPELRSLALQMTSGSNPAGMNIGPSFEYQPTPPGQRAE
jgi:hypothetical protein